MRGVEPRFCTMAHPAAANINTAAPQDSPLNNDLHCTKNNWHGCNRKLHAFQGLSVARKRWLYLSSGGGEASAAPPASAWALTWSEGHLCLLQHFCLWCLLTDGTGNIPATMISASASDIQCHFLESFRGSVPHPGHLSRACCCRDSTRVHKCVAERACSQEAARSTSRMTWLLFCLLLCIARMPLDLPSCCPQRSFPI